MTISKENTRTLLTIPKDVKNKLSEIAKEENRSVNNLIMTIIYEYLKDREGK